jgi:hypothetical protein
MFPQETYIGSICLGPGEFKIRSRVSFTSGIVINVHFLNYLYEEVKEWAL